MKYRTFHLKGFDDFSEARLMYLNSGGMFLSLTAVGELVNFVRKFTLLLDMQIASTRALMRESSEIIFEAVSEIQDKANIQAMAQDMESSLNTKDPEREKVLDEYYNLGRSLDIKMELLGGLDVHIQEMLLRIMGAASIDDVIYQRIEHTIYTINILNEVVTSILRDKSLLSLSEITKFRNKILTSIYRSYTMEEERRVFHSVFGTPKSKGAA